MAWVSLCEIGELVEGQGKYVEIEGFRLAVWLSAGKVYVMDDYCPHAGRSLSGGHVENGCAVCPWHGWSFKLEDGAMPGAEGVMVKTYGVRMLEREGKETLVQAELPMY
jgi:nitrite reductase/ring-hydroxylating ferredoxin subunit